MGNRSEVAVAITKECSRTEQPYELPAAFFREDMFEQPPDERDGALLFHASDTKWYDGTDKMVTEVMDFLRKLDEEDTEDFLFARVGDEAGDDEIFGNFWENPWELRIARRLDFEGREV
jgi:hypothetical protein